MTQASAQSAHAWGDATNEMSFAWTGFSNIFAEQLRGTLLPQLQELLEWVKQHPAEIRRQATELASAVGAAISQVMTAAHALLPVLEVVGHHPWLTLMVLAAPAAIRIIASLVTITQALTAAQVESAVATTAQAAAFRSEASAAAEAAAAGTAARVGSGAFAGLGRAAAFGAGGAIGSQLAGGSGASQIGAGVGSAAGGFLAPVAIGSAFGPLGTLGGLIVGIIGAAIGGIAGHYAGKLFDNSGSGTPPPTATAAPGAEPGASLYLPANAASGVSSSLNGLDDAAIVLTRSLSDMLVPSVKAINDQMLTLNRYVSDLLQQLAQANENNLAAQSTSNLDANGSGSGTSIDNLTLQISGVDANTTADAIARKIQRPLSAALKQQQRDLDARTSVDQHRRELNG